MVMLCVLAAPAAAQRTIDRADYADRLRAMWLGECIANWTGCAPRVPDRAAVSHDADWGTTPPGRGTIDFVLDQDPWRADDDTMSSTSISTS
jgi:hypothetical protein